MDPRTRIEAALALERPDRPPAASWGHTFREEWSPSELARATVRRARRHGWDFVKLQPRACCFAEAFGSRYRPSGDDEHGPVLIGPAVASLNDWAELPAADPEDPALADQVEALRIVVAELGPTVPVIQTVFSPLTVAGYLVGEDKSRAAHELRDHPEVLGPALERIADALSGFAARSVAAGAAGVFYAVSGYASADLLSLEDYERLALDHDEHVLGSIPDAAWFNVLHLCGARIHFEVASALRTQAVSWSIHEAGNPSLVEGRERATRAAMGGIDHVGTLVRGTPAAVREEVRAAVSSTGGAGALIAPGCSVPPEAPPENLRAVAISPED